VSGVQPAQFLVWVVMVWLAGAVVFWARLAGGWVVAARMRSVLRRAAGRGDPCIRHRGIALNPVTHAVERDGVPIPMTAHEFSVLEALLQRPGAVLSRAQIEDRLYGWSDSIESNAIEVYIHALRRKLGSESIRTVRGVGYFIPK